jgi:tetratricopeptide (TPR) repeat protein
VDAAHQAVHVDPGNAYYHYMLASAYWYQGNYTAMWPEFDEACAIYSRQAEAAKQRRDSDFFMSFGRALHDAGRLTEASDNFRLAISLEPDQAGTLGSLMRLLNKLSDDTADEQLRLEHHWEAHKAYRRAERLLLEKGKLGATDSELIELAELHSSAGDYARAREHLESLLEHHAEPARVHSDLGIICAYQDPPDYSASIRHFTTALRLNPYDLAARCNLAEAFWKSGRLEDSEREYRRALRVSPGQVEAHIGLGEIHNALGDQGDPDMYDRAIRHFNQALWLADHRQGSKRLTKKERSAVHYSKGYGYVKLYENGGRFAREGDINSALREFGRCCDLDAENQRAVRARDKIRMHVGLASPAGLLSRYGPVALTGCAFVVLLLAQIGFWTDILPSRFQVNSYIVVTFGSLLFVVAGLSLPQLLKLKVAGIELEKSAIDQLARPATLGISPSASLERK